MKNIVQPEFIVISRTDKLPLDNNSKPSVDYQSELVAVWSKLVNEDGSGILEKTITHSWGCSCCTQDPEYLARKKKYYKRKSKEDGLSC